MNPELLKEYEQMINYGMCSYLLRDMNTQNRKSLWISDNVFVWAHSERENIMVTVKPNDVFDLDHHYTLDIMDNHIRIYKEYSTMKIEMPHIKTEEEYFQLSTVMDIEMFPLHIYVKCKELFDKVVERCGVYK